MNNINLSLMLDDKIEKALFLASEGKDGCKEEIISFLSDPDYLNKVSELEALKCKLLASIVSNLNNMSDEKALKALSAADAIIKKAEAVKEAVNIILVLATYQNHKEARGEKDLSKASKKVYEVLRKHPIFKAQDILTIKYIRHILKPMFTK